MRLCPVHHHRDHRGDPWGERRWQVRGVAAQAMGRFTGMPDPLNGIAQGPPVAIVHPTFLDEMIWDLGVAALVVGARPPLPARSQASLRAVCGGYTAGWFWIELMRTNPATMVVGLRINGSRQRWSSSVDGRSAAALRGGYSARCEDLGWFAADHVVGCPAVRLRAFLPQWRNCVRWSSCRNKSLTASTPPLAVLVAELAARTKVLHRYSCGQITRFLTER